MSMTMELKCCPFCGGEAESDSQRGYRNISTGNPENAAAIYCTKCNADMTWCYRDTPEVERDQVMTLLIEQWNTRASTASLDREKVARIIDPAAFSIPKHPAPDDALWRGQARQTALAKADAILSTIAPDEAAIRAKDAEISTLRMALEDATSGISAACNEASIRATAFEEAAKIAESECYATTGRQIGACIRGGRS